MTHIFYTTKKQKNKNKKMVEETSVAQKDWFNNTTLEQRQEMCRNFVTYCKENVETFAKDITGEMGKPIKEARGEMNGFVERGNKMIELSQNILQTEEIPGKQGVIRKIRKEPIGTVFIIAPWFVFLFVFFLFFCKNACKCPLFSFYFVRCCWLEK